MEIKPIKTETDYSEALLEVEKLMNAKLNTPEGDKLDVLVTLIEAYEEKHHQILPPDPVEAIIHQMESQKLSRKDLESFLLHFLLLRAKSVGSAGALPRIKNIQTNNNAS